MQPTTIFGVDPLLLLVSIIVILSFIVQLTIYIGEKIQQSKIVKILEDALERAQATVPVTLQPPLPQPVPPRQVTPTPAPLPPPKPVPVPIPSGPFASYPSWFQDALKEIGFHETGNNQGIQRYIDMAHTGSEGDPWCAIFANAMLEEAGIPGTRSPSSQSFRTSPNFIPLSGPVPGAIAVYWRGSPSSGMGHVGFYRGENATSVWTLGGNENDMVEIAALPKSSNTFGLIGYWWPKSVPVPSGAGPVTMPTGSPVEVKAPPVNPSEPTTIAGPGVQKNIIATYFGGQQSAYGGPIIDSKPGVALPLHFVGARPQVKVTNPKTGASVVADIVDVGPWNDIPADPYWETGARPQAESGTDLHGRKTNKAGIDLTLAAATAVGIDGKGLVNWEFVSPQPPSVT